MPEQQLAFLLLKKNEVRVKQFILHYLCWWLYLFMTALEPRHCIKMHNQ